MKNPHLKLGDTHKAVKHLIRALRKSSMVYYFKPNPNSWHDRNGLRRTKYKCYSYFVQAAVWGFQIREGLPRTGECDAATWARLERFLK